MKKAAAVLDGKFFYSVVNRLATLEEQSEANTRAFKAMFEDVLKIKTIKQLSLTESRLGTKGTMQDLADDVKYLLHGKHFDQFMRESVHFASMTKPVVKADSHAFREWLHSNKPNLAV